MVSLIGASMPENTKPIFKKFTLVYLAVMVVLTPQFISGFKQSFLDIPDVEVDEHQFPILMVSFLTTHFIGWALAYTFCRTFPEQQKLLWLGALVSMIYLLGLAVVSHVLGWSLPEVGRWQYLIGPAFFMPIFFWLAVYMYAALFRGLVMLASPLVWAYERLKSFIAGRLKSET